MRLGHPDHEKRQTNKLGKSYCGCKTHANRDAPHKFIRKIRVRPANMDDGQTLKKVQDR
jgi:hypothetical protein